MKRLVVGAHYGLRDWLVQRITAVIMALYTLIMLAVLFNKSFNYDSWKALFAQGWMRVATLLFAASLAWHAWVGMRDILMDYVKPTGWRLGLEVLVIAVLVIYGGWAAQILWRA